MAKINNMAKIKKGFWYRFWCVLTLGQLIAFKKAIALALKESRQ